MDEVTIAIDQEAQNFLSALLAFIMFSVALGLKLPDFKSLIDRPRPVVYGLLAQLLGLPLLTITIIYFLNPSASIALGMIVVASCPGGNISNFLTSNSNGDVALSVTLTSIVSISAVILTPVAIIFWADLIPSVASLIGEINLNVMHFLSQTILILGLPLLAGMWVAVKHPSLATKVGPVLRNASFAILIFFIIAMALNNKEILLDFGIIILPLVILHNTLALILGNVVGRMAKGGSASTRAITFEVGIQNSGLGLVILLSQFDGLGGAAMVTATWGLWHVISGLLLSSYYRQRDKKLGVSDV
jgi:BASS family bile acid:Na+ symporter